jgi:hypothetical protein
MLCIGLEVFEKNKKVSSLTKGQSNLYKFEKTFDFIKAKTLNLEKIKELKFHFRIPSAENFSTDFENFLFVRCAAYQADA